MGKGMLRVGNVTVRIIRKDIKNLYLSVYPPTGEVRISAPREMGIDALRLFTISRLAWIKKQKARYGAQERETPREMLERESHFLWGERYLLRIIEGGGHSRVERKSRKIELHIPPGTTLQQRRDILDKWYRDELRRSANELLLKWEPLAKVKVQALGIKKMRTKWGSCNTRDRRVWLNTELAKKPIECLEYVLVHEMVHLLERHHTSAFLTHMARLLPQWEAVKNRLNSFPLKHEEWEY